MAAASALVLRFGSRSGGWKGESCDRWSVLLGGFEEDFQFCQTEHLVVVTWVRLYIQVRIELINSIVMHPTQINANFKVINLGARVAECESWNCGMQLFYGFIWWMSLNPLRPIGSPVTHENWPMNWPDFATSPALLGWPARNRHTAACMHRFSHILMTTELVVWFMLCPSREQLRTSTKDINGLCR